MIILSKAFNLVELPKNLSVKMAKWEPNKQLSTCQSLNLN